MENHLPLAVWASALLSCLLIWMGLNKVNYFKRNDYTIPALLMIFGMLFTSVLTMDKVVTHKVHSIPAFAKHDKTTIYYFDAVDKENGILAQTDYCATNNPHPLGRTVITECSNYNFIGFRLYHFFYAP